ncbi:MAG: riboflavin kinase [Bacteroidales bacterium]|nr:riboflavin kinase [Bacteroidales bacterium]
MLSFLLEGTVVHGQQLGRQLGFPTANLDVAHLSEKLPTPGVYAASAYLDDGRHFRAMVNIGFRPTVDASRHTLSIEAYLDGFDGDLYGQHLSLTLLHRIRSERKMSSLDELQEQLAADLHEVRKLVHE